MNHKLFFFSFFQIAISNLSTLKNELREIKRCVPLWTNEVPGDAAVHGVWRRGSTVGGGHQR